MSEATLPDYWREGIDLIEKLWDTDYGTFKREYLDTHREQIILTTGGWSENEEAINIIADTMFWVLFWQKSERGGKYTFMRELSDNE